MRPTEQSPNTRQRSVWLFVRNAHCMTRCSADVAIADASCEPKSNLREKSVHKENGNNEGSISIFDVGVGSGDTYNGSYRNCASKRTSRSGRSVSGICFRNDGDAYASPSIQWQICLYAQVVQRLSEKACSPFIGTWSAQR